MSQKKIKIQEYNAVFQEESEGGFSVWIPSLPGCASQGETFEEALANIKVALELYWLSNNRQFTLTI
jgi:predicted RNase H-like HicB family nuclease